MKTRSELRWGHQAAQGTAVLALGGETEGPGACSGCRRKGWRGPDSHHPAPTGRLSGRCSQVCHSGALHKDEWKWVSVRGDIRKNIIRMRTVQEWNRGPERLCHLHPTWAGQSPGQPGGGQAAPVLSRRLDRRPPKVPFSLNYPVNLWAHLDSGMLLYSLYIQWAIA